MERQCEIEDCDRPLYATGLCRKHYDRARHHEGDPLAPDGRFAFDPFSAELWDHIAVSDDPDECWPWMHGQDGSGYGKVGRDGRVYTAHRLAYAFAYGPIPPGLYVLHYCDNRPCCNPTHFFLGTHADNMTDMARKGRGRSGNKPGEANNMAKLTQAQVDEIRRRWPGESRKAIARTFGVHPSTIGRIVNRKRWL